MMKPRGCQFEVFHGLLLLLAGMNFAQAKIQGAGPSHGPARANYRYVTPGSGMNSSASAGAGTTVSATAGAAKTEDAPDSGHLGFTLSGTETVPARMVDPYRVINGQTNMVGAGWVIFSGKVTGGDPYGIRLEGTATPVPKSDDVLYGEFYVANFPDLVALNDVIGSPSRWYYARAAGAYQFTNTTGEVQTLRKLDYGLPWQPGPPTPEQLAARKQLKAQAKAAADEKKNEILARAVKANEEAAANGDATGLLRMGERYRDGKGVERDMTKAREYLRQAALKGSLTAQSELDMLKK